MTLALLLLFLAAPDVAELEKTLAKHAKDPYEQRRRTDAIRKLGRIGTVRSTEALVELLEDPFAHVRDAAVSGLIGLKRHSGRADALAFLGRSLKRGRRPGTRRHLATALGLIGDPAAVPALAAALAKEKDATVVAALALALERLGGGNEALVAKARRGPGRGACVRALRNTPELVKPFAADKDDDVRAAVAEAGLPLEGAIGERAGIALAERGTDLTRLFAHASWRVRAAAIASAAKARDPASIAPLVDLLANETGRLRADAWQALRELTGKDIPPDAEQWRALLPVENLPPAAVRERKLPGATVAYFGLPVFSERVAFVFDVSGSMRDDNKIETARAKFAETAAKLTGTQRYDLFVYRYLLDYPPRPKLERCFGKLVTGKTRTAAKWLGKQPARGGGAIYDALVAAMDDPDVDTIYLLSDGVPSYGTVARDFRVLQEVRRHNRWRRVVIHTILLGTRGTDRKFMQRLAAENGGVAVDANGKRLG